MLKVLFICDDIWHPADVVERGLSTMDHEDIEFDLMKTAKDMLTPKLIAEYPVIICNKGNAINAANSKPWFEPGVTECMPEDFSAYVKNGGGFLAMHVGLVPNPKDVPAYTELVGAYFLDHPPREVVSSEIIDPDHPIAQGVQNFAERDEHYQIALTAQDAKVFMLSKSPSGGIFAGGYSREYGKGRVVGLTPGHTLSIWSNPNFQKLFKNSIRWCAKQL